MRPWGAYELSRQLSLSMREREIVIDRTCARCGCEYEFGVHVAFYAERVGLDTRQVASIVDGSPEDDCWTDHRESLLIRAVDALHDDADIPDPLGTSSQPSSDRRTSWTCSCSAAGTTPSASSPARCGCRSRPVHRRSHPCWPPLGAEGAS